MVINKIEIFQQTPLFRGLHEQEMQVLAERAIERHLVVNEVLFSRGETAHGLYVIAKGAVRAVRESADGREQVIHVERAITSFAEVAVFDGGTYPSTVIAEEDSELLFIDKKDMKRLCLDYPQIAFSALKLLAGRLRRCAELVERLSLHPVSQRLASWLAAEAKLKGTETATGVRFKLSLTNQQIAARIGSVREVVSRAFTQLQQEGLIVMEGREVTIPHPHHLQEYIEN